MEQIYVDLCIFQGRVISLPFGVCIRTTLFFCFKFKAMTDVSQKPQAVEKEKVTEKTESNAKDENSINKPSTQTAGKEDISKDEKTNAKLNESSSNKTKGKENTPLSPVEPKKNPWKKISNDSKFFLFNTANGHVRKLDWV